jgi:Flp pilus assembly protein TadD
VFTRLAVILCCLTIAASGQLSDYDRGIALFEKGQPDAAIPFLRRATERHPREPMTWKALGVAHAATGQYELAEPALRRACELNEKLEDACYFQARALYAMNRFEPSLEALAKAPNSWKVHLGMAQALEALDRAPQADTEFRKSVSLCSDRDPQPGTAYGRFLIRQGQFEAAVAPLTAVLGRYPGNSEAHTHLGRAMLERGQLEAAIAHFELAVQLNPTLGQAHLLLAKAYVRSGRAAEAQPHFEAASRYEQATQ